MQLNSREERRSFAKMALFLTLPVVGQNVLHMAVNTADVVMLGNLSQTALSASSLANQIQFILSLFFFGISRGASLLAAQYWGKGDTKSIENVLGISLRFSVVVSLVFALAAYFAPESLMSLFTPDPELIKAGAEYLRIISISYVFMSVTLMYLSIMRSMERVLLSTAVSAVSLAVNVTLNALLIFGLLGFPKMGVAGAALATAIARAVELVICIVDSRINKYVRIHVKNLFVRNKLLFKDFVKYSLPALGNDIVWGIGFSMYAVIMGHLGSDVVAANSIAQMILNIAKIAANGLATSTGIIVGKALGQNLLDYARAYAKRLVKATFFAALAGGLLILALRPFIVNFGEISGQAREYLGVMIFISSYYIFGPALNTTIICGVFRAGGDTKFGLICDILDMWCFAIPLGFLCAFVFKLPPMWVYFFIFLDEFVKMPFIFVHYKKEKWLRNITRDSAPGQQI